MTNPDSYRLMRPLSQNEGLLCEEKRLRGRRRIRDSRIREWHGAAARLQTVHPVPLRTEAPPQARTRRTFRQECW